LDLYERYNGSRTFPFRNDDRMSDNSPTARALQCLGLLQARPGITAGELARRLDVSTGAVRRYVAILREAEIPI